MIYKNYQFIPENHEFVKVEPRLWRCRWCDGFAVSDHKPSDESRAVSEAYARQNLAPNARNEERAALSRVPRAEKPSRLKAQLEGGRNGMDAN